MSSRHVAEIWGNAQPHRRTGPGNNYPLIDSLSPGETVIVLCYSHGETQTWTTPGGVTNTSDTWDFVFTGDQDAGGYVADVFVDTGGDTAQIFGQQGLCGELKQRLM